MEVEIDGDPMDVEDIEGDVSVAHRGSLSLSSCNRHDHQQPLLQRSPESCI